MIADCSKCFNKKHYPDSALSIICYRCKEQKMWYYRPDLSDMQGCLVTIKENDENEMKGDAVNAR